MIIMQKTRIILLVILGLFISTMATATPAATANTAKSVLLDKVIVIVNDDVITQKQLNAAIYQAKQQLKASGTPTPPYAQLKKQVLNNLIDRTLMLQMVANFKITVSDSELNQALNNLAKQNQITLQQLKQQIEANGLSFAKYRQKFKEQMAISQLQQSAVGKNVKVSDAEVNSFIQKYKNVRNPNAEYHIRDILIPIPDDPSPAQIRAADQQATSLLRQIQQGKSFSELAAANSSGKQAFQGGDLGWRHLAELPTIFADKVSAMSVNQVAGPLKAPNGFHIIKLLGVRNSSQKLSKESVTNLLFRRKFEEQLQIWLRQVREEAYIKFE